MSKVLLIDGSFYVHSCHHALANLQTKEGRATGATYGMTQILLEFYKNQYEYIGIVFDSPVKTFRHLIYPNYKKGRFAMNISLAQQFPDIFLIVESLGFTSFLIDGYEGDDIIGTLSKKFSLQGHQVVIATKDKDMYQLISPNVSIIHKNIEITYDNYPNFMKVHPSQFIDYLALCGDPGDNIPGVKGIGPKTAEKLLNNYKSIENIIENLDNIETNYRKYISADLDNLFLSKTLATILQDLNIDIDIESLKRKTDKINYVDLFIKFRELGFLKFAREISKDLKSTLVFSHIVLSDLTLIAEQICNENTLAFIFTDTDLYFTFNGETSYSIDKNSLDSKLLHSLIAKTRTNVTCDLKLMFKYLYSYDLSADVIVHDIILQSYVLDSTNIPHNITNISTRYLNTYTITNLSQEVNITFLLHKLLFDNLSKELQLKKVYEEIELPLCRILFKMESRGIKIDTCLLLELDKELSNEEINIKHKCVAITGLDFNLDSPKQVGQILFEHLSLPKQIYSNSTAKDILSSLALLHPLPKLIQEYRHIAKLRSNCTNKLPFLINKTTKRLHTHLNQYSTSTGRLSSSDPNLQNIPRESKIRSCFIAPEGYKFIIADYSQIELRVLAHISKDKKLIAAFKQDLDIHKETAMHIFNLKANEITSYHRNIAKRVNFGVVYDMHARGLSRALNISIEESQTYIDSFFQKYKGVHSYMQNTRDIALQEGYVETICKRRIYTPRIYSHNQHIRRSAERLAINARIQGSAADIIKCSMIAVDNWITNIKGIEVNLILQIHDELIVEVPEGFVDEAITQIRDIMTSTLKLIVPLKINIYSNSCWEK